MTTQTTNKVYLVTGASTGIGKEVARGLASIPGNTVVMVSRDAGRAASALEFVRSETKNQDVHSIVADLSSMNEVRRVAKEFESRFPRLDALVNNAAIVPTVREVTVDGFEAAFATNVLGPFLLTELLLETLKRSAPSRVVYTYGGAGKTLDFGNLQSDKGKYVGWDTYSASKIGVAMLVLAQARRLEGTGVSINCALPGIVNTEGMRGINSGFMGFMMLLMRPFMRTPVQGAQTQLWVATSKDLDGVSGKTFGSVMGEWKKPLELPPVVAAPGNADKLYEICRGLARLDTPA